MLIDFPAVAQDTPQAVAQPAPQQSAASYDEQYANARALAASGQVELAIAAWSALLARSPANSDVLLGRATAYTRNKQYDQAETDLRAAAAAAPAYADVWTALGNIYMWTDRPALAVPAYSEAIKLRPADADARLARAAAYRDLGRRDAARADLDQAGALGGDKERIGAIGAALVVRAPVPELSLPAGYEWSAGVSASATRVSLRDQRWHEQSATVRRHFAKGSLGFESLRASRFGQHGTAWALDGYASLWSGAYANARYQRAPSERLFPGTAWRAELFQSVGDGWELSASDDRMNFDGSRVDIYGVGLARYFGSFYVRLRHTSIITEDSRSSGDRLVGRYYYAGNGDDYVELAASRGRSDDPLTLGSGRKQSGGASASYVRYVTPNWGFKIGANYARESGNGSERGVSAGLNLRW